MRIVVGELARRTLAAQSLKWQIVGLLLTVCHVILVKVSLVFYPVVMLLIGWLYVRASIAAVLVFFQILLYQNLIISVFDQDMTPVTFSALQGTNFVVLLIMAVVAALRLLPDRRQHQAIFVSIAAALIFAAIYTAIGIASAGTTAAAIYFRSFAGTALAALVGLDIGRVWSFRTISVCLLYASILLIVLCLVEYFIPVDYYNAINAVKFLQLKYWNQPQNNTFYTPQDIIWQFTSVFFNISGTSHGEYGFDNFRFGGTIMNPISNAYVLGILSIVTIALKRSIWLLLLLPMLVMAGAKGAVTLLLISVILYWFWAAVHNRRLLLIGALCMSTVYIGGGIYFGLRNGDFHVLGFLGGIRSLIHSPIGHGIGVGGNLSVNAATTRLHTEAAFRNVDFALESAVGVLLYQMGIASTAILGVFVTFLYKAPLGHSRMHTLPRRSDVIFFALGAIAMNGIFQEEAYAPYASGLIMLLASVLVGNQRQEGEVVVPVKPKMRYVPVRSITAVCLLFLSGVHAWAVPPDRLRTLERGANISSVFETNADLSIEISQLATAGFRHVRVFVLAESLGDPAYQGRLNELVALTTNRHIGLILCMTSNTQRWRDHSNVMTVWLAAWTKLAERLRHSSSNYVFLELANEPELTNSEQWDSEQSRLRQAVRDILPQHTILLTGSPTSMVWSLVDHPTDVSRDGNVAYSFHLYQPMAVTCQGCECCPADKLLSGLDYPPNESNIQHMMTPATSAVLASYQQHGADMLQHEIDVAAAWSAAHHIPVVATEFGIFSAASEQTRAAWLGEARSRLEAAHIGWTVWEWKGGFGIAPLLPHGPLTEALGLDH